MGVNVDAYFFLAQAAVPHLLESSGNIVNIASNAGLMGQAYTVAYCMSKGAVVLFTKALAMEYAKAPIRVNAIAPGGTDTALSQNFQFPDGVDFELMGRYTGFRPMGSPDDIAALFALRRVRRRPQLPRRGPVVRQRHHRGLTTPSGPLRVRDEDRMRESQ